MVHYMIELKKDEYTRVLPLLNDLNGVCLFANAIIKNNQAGRIFVNNQTNPTCCLIASCGGTYIVAGEEGDLKFNDWLIQYLKNKSNHLNYYDLNATSETWLKLLSNILDGDVVKLSRTIYNFYTNNFFSLNNWSSKIPVNMTLKCMDEELYDKFLNTINPLYKNTWGVFNEFALKGFGFCLLDKDRFVSVCTSDYVAGGYASIDIITMNKYRRKGFASITCSAFIEHCLHNKLIPVWNADSGNMPSNELALKLGFNKIKEYDMLWWHENPDVIKNYLKKYNYSLHNDN